MKRGVFSGVIIAVMIVCGNALAQKSAPPGAKPGNRPAVGVEQKVALQRLQQQARNCMNQGYARATCESQYQQNCQNARLASVNCATSFKFPR